MSAVKCNMQWQQIVPSNDSLAQIKAVVDIVGAPYNANLYTLEPNAKS